MGGNKLVRETTSTLTTVQNKDETCREEVNLKPFVPTVFCQDLFGEMGLARFIFPPLSANKSETVHMVPYSHAISP